MFFRIFSCIIREFHPGTAIVKLPPGQFHITPFGAPHIQHPGLCRKSQRLEQITEKYQGIFDLFIIILVVSRIILFRIACGISVIIGLLFIEFSKFLF